MSSTGAQETLNKSQIWCYGRPEYLEKAYAAHDSEILAINVDPEWDRLRSDPRFIAMVKKVGLRQADAQPTAALE